MILIIAFLAGASFGWVRAGKRRGDRADQIQYAAVHGIVATLLTLGLSILLARLGVL